MNNYHWRLLLYICLQERKYALNQESDQENDQEKK